MRRLTVKTGIHTALLALVMAVSPVQAEGVAVVNMQKALVESAPAKAFVKQSEEKFGPRREQLRKLEEELNKAFAEYQRDEATMSQSERTKVETTIRRKREDYQQMGQALEQEMAKAEQEELSRLSPKLQEAIASVAKKGNYELVVDTRTVTYMRPSLDVTAKVIESLNALAK